MAMWCNKLIKARDRERERLQSICSSSSSSPKNFIHMRIRKRFLSLYGSITTPQSSDLQGGDCHNQQPPSRVQFQELHPNENQTHYPLLSDLTTQIGHQPDTRTSSVATSDRNNNSKILNDLEFEKMKEPIMTECRKESILCEEAKNHDLVMKGWLQGDSLVPTKKKRGSYGRRLMTNDVVQDNEKMNATTMKLKDTKKDEKFVPMSSKKNNKIKEKKDGVIMEGSRCSRVNGRGWRCSQQTLVGYSLCEHHLGKGRARNMTSNVRRQTIARKDKKVESKSIDHDEVEHVNHDDSDDEEAFKDWDADSVSSMEGTKVISKKTKLGVVKARSLSSLLSQI